MEYGEATADSAMTVTLGTADMQFNLPVSNIICPRTVQTLRDNGTLAYTQISHKTYYLAAHNRHHIRPDMRQNGRIQKAGSLQQPCEQQA